MLQGHDHKTDEEYAVMQAEEDRVLARIQQMNV
jgi:ssRNA-specific RNase YbeY (16S rRNA maturation enzyme)